MIPSWSLVALNTTWHGSRGGGGKTRSRGFRRGEGVGPKIGGFRRGLEKDVTLGCTTCWCPTAIITDE